MSDREAEKPNELNLILAHIAYAAYGQTTEYKNFQGNPMPEFEALPDKIQLAWHNAAQAVSNHTMNATADAFSSFMRAKFK